MPRKNKLPNDGQSEKQYLDLLEEIMEYGDDEADRTGVGTKKIHGATMRFDLAGGVIPLLTTKFVPWKAIAHELVWFLSGSTNIRYLLENKVTIWSEWPHQKYVKETGDNISLKDFEKKIVIDQKFAEDWGSIGKGYGHQWRHWDGPDGQVFDQISDVVNLIKKSPGSRRLLFHGWNVADLDKMALPPCHLLYQFYVAKGKLSLTMYQRSCDVGLGVPFNVASCAMLVHMIAAQCDLEPGELFWVGHDVHLYQNHIDTLREVQLPRTPRAFPLFVLKNKPNSLFDYRVTDMDVLDYNPDPGIKLPVAV